MGTYFSFTQFLYVSTPIIPVEIKLGEKVKLILFFPFPCMNLKNNIHRFQHKFPEIKVLEVAVTRQDSTVRYLLELLYLVLLEHGEDIGARLLSSPLSLIGGLLTRLRRGTQTHSSHTLYKPVRSM